MAEKRLMGLDMGDKRIGIAVSDLLMLTAQGVESYTRTESEKKDIAHLCELCVQYNVGKIVCGLPKNMNGPLGPMAEKVQAFAEKLKKASGLEIEFEDERLTTVYAEQMLLQADMSRQKRRKVIDKMAAVAILQSYMDRTGSFQMMR